MTDAEGQAPGFGPADESIDHLPFLTLEPRAQPQTEEVVDDAVRRVLLGLFPSSPQQGVSYRQDENGYCEVTIGNQDALLVMGGTRAELRVVLEAALQAVNTRP